MQFIVQLDCGQRYRWAVAVPTVKTGAAMLPISHYGRLSTYDSGDPLPVARRSPIQHPSDTAGLCAQ